MSNNFDVIIAGGGHAGVEAALAACRIGARVCIVTSSRNDFGEMSCNPSIGGVGKGHIVREIDALDGVMGLAGDYAGTHFKVLNKSKGPAVYGIRAQSDRALYKKYINKTIDEYVNQYNLSIIFGTFDDIIVKNGIYSGLVIVPNDENLNNLIIHKTDGKYIINSKSLVLTTGTFLGAKIQYGTYIRHTGRWENQEIKTNLEKKLNKYNFNISKLKTGTPPRIALDTINTNILDIQPGDDNPTMLSFMNKAPEAKQINSYITRTNPKTHEIIRNNIHLSPTYSNQITDIGPRYCPSIEDKVMKFYTKQSHQIFLEIEGIESNVVYPNGISMGLPLEIQQEAINSIKGFENAKIIRPGYSVEYSFLDPMDLERTLHSKKIEGLFIAGQVNGTTGYEEAAGQGIIAGINAARFAYNLPQIELDRFKSYIGVMISDITSRGLIEPYRLFTSRAENRLFLRPDNADQRMHDIGIEIGCIREQRKDFTNNKLNKLNEIFNLMENIKLSPHDIHKKGYYCKLDGNKKDGLDIIAQFGINALINLMNDANITNSINSLSENEKTSLCSKSLYRNLTNLSELKSNNTNEDISININELDISEFSNEVKAMIKKYNPKKISEVKQMPGITPYAILRLILLSKKQKNIS